MIKSNLAHLLTEVRDLEDIVGWSIGSRARSQSAPPTLDLSSLNDSERLLMTLLQGQDGVHIDELVRQSGMSPGRIASLLVGLEINDAVEALPGKRYKIKGFS